MRRQGALALSAVVMILIGAAAWSSVPKWSAGPPGLEEKGFARPEMRVTSANVPLRDVLSLLPNAAHWNRFLQEQGPATEVYIDPRSGVPSGIQLSLPFIPGDGKNNHLSLEDLGRAVGRSFPEVTPEAVGESLKKFLAKNRDALGLDLSQVGPVSAVKVSEDLWHLSAPQVVSGIPVRFGRVGATVSHGNLILVGAEMWGNVHIDTHPRVEAAEALRAGFDRAGGRRDEDLLWKEPTLEIVPVAAPGRETPYARGRRIGDGYDHWLVWSFGFQRGEEPTRWEVLVDARSGEVVAIQDVSYDEVRKIKGAAFPMTNTGICPSPDRCGTAQPGTPMSFADYLASTYSNSAGVFDYSGTATTTLKGRYISVDDKCGAVSESSASGDIDLGGSSSDHNCTVPPGHSAGDTSAARTAAYELDKIAEMGRGWLPGNTWLQGQPGPQIIRMNRIVSLSNCTASYDPTSGEISTGRGGLVVNTTCCQSGACSTCGQTCGTEECCPECSHECRNPGEIATIIDHEWGHALDRNDANQTMSNTSEAYADIAAAYRTQTSCSGYGFKTTWAMDSEGCTLTSDGTGFNGNMNQVGGTHCLTDCSGVRDADYLKHVQNTPDTPQNFVCTSCSTPGFGMVGPCGREVHCEGAPITQSAWDLAARDLQASPFSYSKTKAFNVANRIFYLGSGNVLSWHTCDCTLGTSDGCGANSGYLQWLAADDDDGNLGNGTPHMTAIYAAFNRHNIACGTPAPVNGGCVGAPTGVPDVTAIAGSMQSSLSWKPVTGASKYFVFRTEGQAGCDMGRAVIGRPTGNAFLDTEVADGRRYYYTVEAVGSSEACSGPTSACRCTTVFKGTPPADVVAASDYQTVWGSIFSGSYALTWFSGDGAEVLKEGLVGGVSKLRHIWKFTNVPDGCLSLNYEASRTKGSDGDDFKFSWAPDVGGIPGTFTDIPLAVIDKPFYPIGGLTFSFAGPGAGSTIYIRIDDTNQSTGSSLDKVNIERLDIWPR
jgi:hypothetical protein